MLVLRIERLRMCRNIKMLFNFDPPATEEEIRAASLQFVRKLSGFNAPSKANEAAFHSAVDEVAGIARRWGAAGTSRADAIRWRACFALEVPCEPWFPSPC